MLARKVTGLALALALVREPVPVLVPVAAQEALAALGAGPLARVAGQASPCVARDALGGLFEGADEHHGPRAAAAQALLPARWLLSLQ